MHVPVFILIISFVFQNFQDYIWHEVNTPHYEHRRFHDAPANKDNKATVSIVKEILIPFFILLTKISSHNIQIDVTVFDVKFVLSTSLFKII